MTVAPLVYFYCNDDPRDQVQTTEPILRTPILRANQLQPVEWEGVAYCSTTIIGYYTDARVR